VRAARHSPGYALVVVESRAAKVRVAGSSPVFRSDTAAVKLPASPPPEPREQIVIQRRSWTDGPDFDDRGALSIHHAPAAEPDAPVPAQAVSKRFADRRFVKDRGEGGTHFSLGVRWETDHGDAYLFRDAEPSARHRRLLAEQLFDRVGLGATHRLLAPLELRHEVGIGQDVDRCLPDSERGTVWPEFEPAWRVQVRRYAAGVVVAPEIPAERYRRME